MAKITTDKLRNVCLLGHGGSGKTSLCEAALFLTGGTDRLGKTADGNTVCDYDPEEIRRGFSLSLSIAPVTTGDVKINFIDTPGFLDFVGEVYQGLRVGDAAIITVDGKAGLEVGTELAWDRCEEAKIPRAFFVGKCDDPEAHFDRVFKDLRERFGVSVCPIFVPTGKPGVFINLIDNKACVYDAKGGHKEADIPAEFEGEAAEYRNILFESIAETSEELMEKFFAEEEITREEAVKAIHDGISSGGIVPVLSGSATNLWGIDEALATIADSFPHPDTKSSEKAEDGSDIPVKTDGTCSIFVFKTIADPFVGKMSFFKVMAGTLARDAVLRNLTSGQSEKMAHIYVIKGKKQTEVEELCCGDIGVITKLIATNTNDTLTAGDAKEYKKIVFPTPYYSRGIAPAAKGDEDKISTGVAKLLEEDLTIKYENNAETKQMLIYGMGDMQLDVVVAKLKTRFGTSVALTEPKIAYREAITKTVQVEGKHKKQSGGHGQYGHVKIEFKPGEGEGLTFTESIFGGSVPKNFHPAVEKGLQESMSKGVLAGYPMVNLYANLFDGSYHDVDSSEMAFKIAANLAYKQLINAGPVILEPIGELKCLVPDSLVGDIVGDLPKRRGIVRGMTPSETKKGYTVVEAEVPKSEMLDYTIALRAMSQGRGSYTFEFVRYDKVPAANAQKIIDEAKANAAAEN
jgi:elongation factor G